MGWFGFNAGSELASDHLAASAFATTHFAAAAGGSGLGVLRMAHARQADACWAPLGLVAGLVCITPAAGFVNLMPALVMGVVAGIVCCVRVQQDQGDVRLRRLARRVRRARRRRNAGRHPDRRVRHAGLLGHRRRQRPSGTKLGLIEGGTRAHRPDRGRCRHLGLQHRRHVHHAEGGRLRRGPARHAAGRNAAASTSRSTEKKANLCVATLQRT